MEDLPVGMRWSLENNRFIMRNDLLVEDRRRPAEQRTKEEVRVKMDNSISDAMVQLTVDCPSKQSGKKPIINTAVWVESNIVQYEQYVSSKAHVKPSTNNAENVSHA